MLIEVVCSLIEIYFVLFYLLGRNNRWFVKNFWFELDIFFKLWDIVEFVLKV